MYTLCNKISRFHILNNFTDNWKNFDRKWMVAKRGEGLGGGISGKEGVKGGEKSKGGVVRATVG